MGRRPPGYLVLEEMLTLAGHQWCLCSHSPRPSEGRETVMPMFLLGSEGLHDSRDN